MPSLHDTYYEVHKDALYRPGEKRAQQFQMAREGVEPGYQTNAKLAREWNCSARHASKARRGKTGIVCKDETCGCPVMQRKLAALKP